MMNTSHVGLALAAFRCWASFSIPIFSILLLIWMAFRRLDLEVVIPLEILTVLRVWLLNLGFPTLQLVLHVTFACKVFLDHPKKNWVSWRGSQPSPVRVSNKTKI
jgi:hypothetical protein